MRVATSIIVMLMVCSISLHARQADTVLLEEARRFDGEFARVIHQGSARVLHRSGLLVDDYGNRHANGNIVVRQGNHKGVIAQDGKLIIPFAYEDIQFHDSYIRLQGGTEFSPFFFHFSTAKLNI